MTQVYAHQRGGQQPEERKRRITPADVRVVEEGLAETVLRGQVHQLAAGVGDGDEVRPGLVCAERFGGLIVEVFEEGERLRRAAGFGCHDVERAGGVVCCRRGQHRAGVGRVEHAQLETA